MNEPRVSQSLERRSKVPISEAFRSATLDAFFVGSTRVSVKWESCNSANSLCTVIDFVLLLLQLLLFCSATAMQLLPALFTYIAVQSFC